LYDEIFKLSKQLSVNAIFTGFVDEEDKPALLRGAKVFVSPSFWEGFGIHILEAMACGTPAVVSRVASIPEVAGGAGIYVDENDNESIKNGINRVLNLENSEYNMLSRRSVAQANKFGWEGTAGSLVRAFLKFEK
jgi:glycosyltransferase involved in cell wall biosynthesis